jgi:hypothetical protein
MSLCKKRTNKVPTMDASESVRRHEEEPDSLGVVYDNNVGLLEKGEEPLKRLRYFRCLKSRISPWLSKTRMNSKSSKIFEGRDYIEWQLML